MPEGKGKSKGKTKNEEGQSIKVNLDLKGIRPRALRCNELNKKFLMKIVAGSKNIILIDDDRKNINCNIENCTTVLMFTFMRPLVTYVLLWIDRNIGLNCLAADSCGAYICGDNLNYIGDYY